MTINDLESKLNEVLDEFTKEIEFEYETFQGQYCTRDDLREMAKQTFYALNNFKKHILDYLREQD